MNDEKVTLVDSWAPSYGRITYVDQYTSWPHHKFVTELFHLPAEVDIAAPRYWCRQHGYIHKPNAKAVRQGHYRQTAKIGTK